MENLELELFDKGFVANVLQNHRRCPKCRNEYSCNFERNHGDAHVKSNRPFLLACNHTMCENCIHQHYKNLECQECLKPIKTPPQKRNLQEIFDLNATLYGQIKISSYHVHAKAANTSFNLSRLASFSLPSAGNDIPQTICDECLTMDASGKCNHCNVHYCQICFTQVHQKSKVLKKHFLIPINQGPKVNTSLHLQSRYISAPKRMTCFTHNKLCNVYCATCKKVYCDRCAKSHSDHYLESLRENNMKNQESIISMLESMKTTRDTLRQSQKDVKSVEKQLQNYASQAIENVSDYFLSLHNFLQNEEKRIIDDLLEKCQEPVKEIHTASTALYRSQNTLNDMRTTLEYLQTLNPADIPIFKTIKECTAVLKNMLGKVEITKISENPFTFTANNNIADIRKEIRKFYSHSCSKPKLSMKVRPIYGTQSQVFPILQQSGMQSLDTSKVTFLPDSSISHNVSMATVSKPKKREVKKQLNNRRTPSIAQQLLQQKKIFSFQAEQEELLLEDPFWQFFLETPETFKLNPPEWPRVNVTVLKDPHSFYVQFIDKMNHIEEEISKFLDELKKEPPTRYFEEGTMYMVYESETEKWHRAMLKNKYTPELYKVFLVDIGRTLKVPPKMIHNIDQSLMNIKWAATLCGIYCVLPIGSKWTADSNDLINEIIDNSQVYLKQIKNENDIIWSVDLICSKKNMFTSVREALIYTGLAKYEFHDSPVDDVDIALPPGWCISKEVYKAGDILTVSVVHVENPHTFYVIKYDDIAIRDMFKKSLNGLYNSDDFQPQLYYNMVQNLNCVVKIDGVWHRASIEHRLSAGNVHVRLVDEGYDTVVGWRQIFRLISKYRQQKEFTFRCSLSNVEPLQKNGYIWTEEAIKDFRKLTSRSRLQLTVESVEKDMYYVTLNYNSKELDINVSEKMVKAGYCTFSHGLIQKMIESSDMEKLKTKQMLASVIKACDRASKVEDNDERKKILQRTQVIMQSVISPGEFYLTPKKTLYEHPHIEKELQIFMSEEAHEVIEPFIWQENDMCLIRATVEQKPFLVPKQTKWYRGIIKEADNESSLFDVFLYDVGVTLTSVKGVKLHPIPDDWRTIVQAVKRCSLACLEPVEESGKWSKSAIEFFTNTLKMFENISVTMHGNPRDNNFPVVLWGETLDTADPLAPSVVKYSNVNRLVAKKGFARLTESLDDIKKLDFLMENDEQQNLIQYQDECIDDSTLMAVNNACKPHETEREGNYINPNYLDFSPSFNLDDIDDGSLSKLNTKGIDAPPAWLSPVQINHTIFVGRVVYIDYNGHMYIQRHDDLPLINDMRDKITRTFSCEVNPMEHEEYEFGQACIARYVDKKFFYRAIVRSKAPNEDGEYDVYFIDYGNEEQIMPKHMRPYAPFPNIPAMVKRYSIAGVIPKNGAEKHTEAVLDTIHNMLVPNTVQVRVSPEETESEVPACEIRINNCSFADSLVEEKLVDRDTDYSGLSHGRLWRKVAGKSKKNRKSQPNKSNKLFLDDSFASHCSKKKPKFDLEEDVESDKSSDNESFMCLVRKIDEINKMSESKSSLVDDNNTPYELGPLYAVTKIGEKKVEKKDEKKSEKSEENNQSIVPIYSNYDEMPNSMYEREQSSGDNDSSVESDADMIVLEQKFKTFNTKSTEDGEMMTIEDKMEKPDSDSICTPSSTYTAFKPLDTSTCFNEIINIESFRRPILPSGMLRFKCDAVNVLTPTIVQIRPHINEFDFRDMQFKLRLLKLEKNLKPLTNFEMNTICLAKTADSDKYYRAFVSSENPHSETVEVIFVDNLMAGSIPRDKLRECPKELKNWPLRTFGVRLHGIEANPELNRTDVINRLSQTLMNRTLYVQIIDGASTSKQSGVELTQVSLYDVNNEFVTIYDTLLKEEFYIRTSED